MALWLWPQNKSKKTRGLHSKVRSSQVCSGLVVDPPPCRSKNGLVILGAVSDTKLRLLAIGTPTRENGCTTWFGIFSINGMMTRQIMVLESEWKHGVLVSQNAEVDGDFQKLVQARAEVRVWISSSHNPALAQQHLANCKKQVQLFSGSLPGDTYLFIINDWTTPTTRIERFELH